MATERVRVSALVSESAVDYVRPMDQTILSAVPLRQEGACLVQHRVPLPRLNHLKVGLHSPRVCSTVLLSCTSSSGSPASRNVNVSAISYTTTVCGRSLKVSRSARGLQSAPSTLGGRRALAIGAGILEKII